MCVVVHMYKPMFYTYLSTQLLEECFFFLFLSMCVYVSRTQHPDRKLLLISVALMKEEGLDGGWEEGSHRTAALLSP